MRCPSRKEIAKYALAPREVATSSRCAAHLASGCERCAKELEAMKALVAALAQDDVWEEVPAHFLEKALAVFPDAPPGRTAAPAPAQAPARTPAGPGLLVPQLATRAGESAPAPSDGALVVTARGRDARGQVFDPSREDLSGLTVTLRDEQGVEVMRTLTDRLGRFAFKDLVPGMYTVTLTGGGRDATCRVSIKGS